MRNIITTTAIRRAFAARKAAAAIVVDADKRCHPEAPAICKVRRRRSPRTKSRLGGLRGGGVLTASGRCGANRL